MAPQRRQYFFLPSIYLILITTPLAISQEIVESEGSKFDTCQHRLESILNGTLSFNGITNTTIHELGYIYHGPMGGLKPTEYAMSYRQNHITTITTSGCKAICEDPVDWYWTSDPSLTLGIVSNWILPIIALLAALPFDGGSNKGRRGEKRKRARDTARAVWNWLGSPQTALTATFFNIHQMRVCLDAANVTAAKKEDEPSGSLVLFGEKEKAVAKDAFYVLSCIGQFEPPKTEGGVECFLNGVVYGLFKPAGAITSKLQPSSSSSSPIVKDYHTLQAERWTGDLLRAMARQMRRSRRLGIYSTLASIFLFFVAYAASVVLAFAEGLGERTTTHSLAFGILITWLPLLLLFSILDRNPNSADRTREFIHRWLWNVRAVREWERRRELDPHSEELGSPYWWTRDREKRRDKKLLAARVASTGGLVQDASEEDLQKATRHITRVMERRLQDVCCGVRITPRERQCHHEMGTFVGQGRKMGYYGLALSVVNAVRTSSMVKAALAGSDEEAAGAAHEDFYISLAEKTRENLRDRPPLAWTMLALTALAMVWWELGMALVISYNIPTVGIGCRSGSYLVYGGLSTVPWLAHVYRYLVLGPSRESRSRRGWLMTSGRHVGEWISMFLDGLSKFCMLMSVPCLVVITFAAFSGVLKNCTCRGGINQYIDFESASLYSNPEIFNVRVWWIVAAVTAAIPVVMSFVVALPLLVFKLQPLWQEEQEKEPELELEDMDGSVDGEVTGLLGADMEWVAR